MSKSNSSNEASAPQDPMFELVVRLLLVASGAALLASGDVAAFTTNNDVATAALLAAGFALAFLGYLGKYITRIKFREFEAELERIQRKAVETLSSLAKVARSYESIRSSMSSGGPRDEMMDKQLADTIGDVPRDSLDNQRLRDLFTTGQEGDRITALGIMKAIPELRNFDLILQAIREPLSPYEQDRFLVLASESLYKFSNDEKQQLRETIVQVRETGSIKPSTIRWLSAERLLRLMAR